MAQTMNPMNRIKTEQISGNTVQITLLPATEGITMAKELAEVVVPTVGTFYQGISEGNVDFEGLSMVLISEMGKLNITEIIHRLVRGMAINGGDVNFDEYFMANYGLLIQIIAFALKENFQSFFDASGLFAKYLPKVEKEPAEVE